MGSQMTSKKWVVWLALVTLFWGQGGIFGNYASAGYGDSRILTLFLSCVSYAVVGVPVCLLILTVTRDRTKFPRSAICWSVAASFGGASGNLCILAAVSLESPLYVIPLVYGGAQLSNFFFTALVDGLRRDTTPAFWGSFALMIASSYGVQQFRDGRGFEDFSLHPGSWLFFVAASAVCWGVQGVFYRRAMGIADAASGGLGRASRLRPIVYLGLVYSIFGAAIWGFGALGLSTSVSFVTLTSSIEGLRFGVVTGVFGIAGAIAMVRANTVAGSPGPALVMALAYIGASTVNTFASGLWDYLYKNEVHPQNPVFWFALVILVFSTFTFAQTNPNR